MKNMITEDPFISAVVGGLVVAAAIGIFSYCKSYMFKRNEDGRLLRNIYKAVCDYENRLSTFTALDDDEFTHFSNVKLDDNPFSHWLTFDMPILREGNELKSQFTELKKEAKNISTRRVLARVEGESAYQVRRYVDDILLPRIKTVKALIKKEHGFIRSQPLHCM